MFSKMSLAVKSFARKVLDLDDTSPPVEHIELLNDFLVQNKFHLDVSSLKELVKSLKRKHVVDSICISTLNGSLVVSTDGNEWNEAVIGSAMYSYILSEIPKSKSVFIKTEDHWFMLFPYNEKIYIVRAGSNLTSVELNAIAREVEAYLKIIDYDA